jgi:hypothetical protein
LTKKQPKNNIKAKNILNLPKNIKTQNFLVKTDQTRKKHEEHSTQTQQRDSPTRLDMIKPRT